MEELLGWDCDREITRFHGRSQKIALRLFGTLDPSLQLIFLWEHTFSFLSKFPSDSETDRRRDRIKGQLSCYVISIIRAIFASNHRHRILSLSTFHFPLSFLTLTHTPLFYYN